MSVPALFMALAAPAGALAALPPPPPPAPPDVSARSASEVLVIDGETLSIRTMRVRLFGVSAPDKSQQCESPSGSFISCGASARAALEAVVANQPVFCKIAGEDRSASSPAGGADYVRLVGRCFAGRLDIAQALVDEGYLVARAPSPYAGSAVQACVAARGLWAFRFEAPWTFKRRRAGVVVGPRMLGQSSGTPCAALSRAV